MRVFISYSTNDGLNYAKKLHGILSNHGHDPFLAEHDIIASENIWDKIARECLERDLSIFLMTPSSIISEGQKKEYNLAISYNKGLMAFISHNLNYDEIFEVFPFIKSYKALDFDDINFDSQCEELSTQLVKLLDSKRRIVTKQIKKSQDLPILSTDDLDTSVIKNCIKHLQESYQYETIIPDICDQIITHDNSDNFISIGFHYRLPREWFLPYEATKQSYSNEHMFREFGRTIAFGEQEYLEKSILENTEIANMEVEFSPDGILEAVNRMRINGYEPNIFTTPIKYWIDMQHWVDRAHIQYSYTTPRTRLNSALILEGCNLQIIHPLGVFPKNTILISKEAIKWHIKKYPKQSALFTVLGNHHLYPSRYVELLAGTECICEIKPKGISILKFKES